MFKFKMMLLILKPRYVNNFYNIFIEMPHTGGKRRGTRHAKKRSTRGKRHSTRKMKGGACKCSQGNPEQDGNGNWHCVQRGMNGSVQVYGCDKTWFWN